MLGLQRAAAFLASPLWDTECGIMTVQCKGSQSEVPRSTQVLGPHPGPTEQETRTQGRAWCGGNLFSRGLPFYCRQRRWRLPEGVQGAGGAAGHAGNWAPLSQARGKVRLSPFQPPGWGPRVCRPESGREAEAAGVPAEPSGDLGIQATDPGPQVTWTKRQTKREGALPCSPGCFRSGSRAAAAPT